MLRTVGSATSLVLVMVACGGGGGGAVGVATGGVDGFMPAPSGLLYHEGNYQGAILVALDVGRPFRLDPPTVSGTVKHFSVSPALPAGVSLDPTTGVISGTPLTAAPEATYTITASNDAGSTNTALDFVVFVPPSALSYPGPANGTVGVVLTGLVPTLSGDASSYAVRPALPAGLTLDSATGVVSGTPASARITATYTITASNAGGASTTFDLLLSVDPPPAGTVATGVFRDPTVIGLGYVSGAHSGVTNDKGEFTYDTGQPVTFSVGHVNLGTVPSAKALLTPLDLVAKGTGASIGVLNVVRFLMMLDQDGDPSNGIQISAAVTAAAAGWPPVDFNTTDLPTAVGPLVQQASAADGVSHALPDAASAQAQLLAAFECTYAGRYDGTYAANSTQGDHAPITMEIFPDGSVHTIASSTATLAGFDVMTASALNPLLDATFAVSSLSPKVSLQGSFSDPTYLSGTYVGDAAGTFEAAGGGADTYKFIGTYTVQPIDPPGPAFSEFLILGMNNSNHVSGSLGDYGSLDGTVSGSAFAGLLTYSPFPYLRNRDKALGTFSKDGFRFKLDGEIAEGGYLEITFSTVGCRAN